LDQTDQIASATADQTGQVLRQGLQAAFPGAARGKPSVLVGQRGPVWCAFGVIEKKLPWI
jgi:hypothetical protein